MSLEKVKAIFLPITQKIQEHKEGQIKREFNKAEEATNQLMINIDELENLLSDILHIARPPIDDDVKELESHPTLFACRIHNHCRFIQYQRKRLENLMDRLIGL